MGMKRAYITGTACLVAMSAVGAIYEARADRVVHGARFLEGVQTAGTQLDLRGAGILRYRWLVKVYAAALYVDAAQRNADPLNDVAKRLEVEYFVAAKASDFNEAGNEVLEETLEPADLDAVRERVDRIASWFPDPRPGDRCALTYIPGRGTELTFNGESLGVVPGDDFQRAYFGIWLGKRPASEALRDALLGAAPTRGGGK